MAAIFPIRRSWISLKSTFSKLYPKIVFFFFLLHIVRIVHKTQLNKNVNFIEGGEMENLTKEINQCAVAGVGRCLIIRGKKK